MTCTPKQTGSPIKYRPDIDGLRAVAVLSVVLYHANLWFIPGGFVGVDVFFVISGFLITGIIHKELVAGRFSILRFYERRARRILPALFAVLGTMFLFVALVQLPRDLEQLADQAIASTLFVANLFFWKTTFYFHPDAHTRLLLHMWSLAVEEQFYLFFPPALYAMHRVWPQRLKHVVALVALVSWLLCVAVTASDPLGSFYLPHIRAWELLFGSLLALGAFPVVPALAPAAGVIGLTLLAGSFALIGHDIPFPGSAATFPVVGTALLIWAGTSPNPASRLLSWRPFVRIGLISYSLYLWHWPIILVLRRWLERDLHPAEVVPYVALSTLFAWLSWRFVETPFRRPSDWMPSERVFTASGAAALVTLVIALVASTNRGFPERYPDVQALAETYDTDRMKEPYRYKECFLEREQPPEDYDLDACVGDTERAVLLWGDSHAAHLYPGLVDALAPAGRTVVLAASAACAPFPGVSRPNTPNCLAFNGMVSDLLGSRQWEAVMLSAKWRSHVEDWESETPRTESLRGVLAKLEARDIDAYVIGESPTFESPVLQVVMDRRVHGNPSLEATTLDTQTTDRALAAIADAHGAMLLDVTGAFCTGDACALGDDTSLYFWDRDHFTVVGSRRAAQHLLRGTPLAGNHP